MLVLVSVVDVDVEVDDIDPVTLIGVVDVVEEVASVVDVVELVKVTLAEQIGALLRIKHIKQKVIARITISSLNDYAECKD